MKNFGEFSAVSGKSDGAINVTESDMVTLTQASIKIFILVLMVIETLIIIVVGSDSGRE